MNKELAILATTLGIHLMGAPNPQLMNGPVHNYELAMDATPELVTIASSGIPAYLSTYFDPDVIKVLVFPMKAAEYAQSEVKKGDWLMDTASFPISEATGEVASYGDYNNEGRANANVNWVFRQAYHYQVFTRWGEKELEKMGLARIDWANQQTMASVLTLNKFQNKSYWFGVANLKLYGLLNDPSLPAPIQPASVGGNTSWDDKGAQDIYDDIRNTFKQLQSQMNGLVEMTDVIIMGLSPEQAVNLAKVTQYNVNVSKMLSDNFPNLKVITAPEFSTDSGELLQMYVPVIDGQRTLDVAFTEKLRAHAIVVESSSFKQKKSQGTWGGLIKRPLAIAQMLGF